MTDNDGPEVAEVAEAPAGAEPNGADSEEHRASRRRFIIGGAVGGAAVLATGAALLTREESEPRLTTNVLAQRVRRVPAHDPESSVWSSAPTAHVEMAGQTTTLPSKPEPSVTRVKVQALYDATTIGFRIEWADEHRDDLAIGALQFRDACAVLLAPDAVDTNLLFMGSADVPVTLLHWKADWQRDVDKGRQYPGVEFPNATYDYYPPMPAASGDDVTFADYKKADATPWVPGFHVDNPMSAGTRSTPVEKIFARGFGTATTAATQDADGRGVWKDGHWQVTLSKPLRPIDGEEFRMRRGHDYGMAVAVWAGNQNDRGARKSPSRDYLQLVLE